MICPALPELSTVMVNDILSRLCGWLRMWRCALFDTRKLRHSPSRSIFLNRLLKQPAYLRSRVFPNSNPVQVAYTPE
jgi:hypothetical protein